MANEFQPYIGPRPFEREDHGLFFGRDRETRDLRSLVTAHQIVLFYAQSGTGKTSLLNAGLVPELEAEQFEILPVTRVRGLIPKGLQVDQISNIYVFNTLMSWAESGVNSRQLAQRSLAEFLNERKHHLDQKGVPSFRVVIFDQFEELFLSYQGRRRDREEFFQQIADALQEDPLLRVIFAIREDYVALLDPYAHLLPDKLRTRYRMEPLRSDAACLAVEGPLRDTGRSFSEGVVPSLVRQLVTIRAESITGEIVEMPGEYVEPVQLQIVCQNLWLNLPQDVRVISSEHLQAFGDVQQALIDFYERAIEKVKKETGINEGDLRDWFNDKLITALWTRGTVVRGKESTEGIPNSAVYTLEAQHIIRAEMRAGAHWFELIHDRLIEPIRQSNEAFRRSRRIDRMTTLVVAGVTLLVFLLFWVNFFDILMLDTMLESCTIVLGDQFLDKQFHENIVIIPIDKETENEIGCEFGRSWRKEHAKLITNLSKAGAKVIVFDMFFEGSSEFDVVLAEAMRGAKDYGTSVIVGVERFEEGKPVLVEELRSAVSGWGAIAIGRRPIKMGFTMIASLIIEKQGLSEPVPGLALRSVAAYMDANDVNDVQLQVEYYDPNSGDTDILVRFASETEQLQKYKFLQWEKILEDQRGAPIVEKGDVVANLAIDLTPLSMLRDKSRRYPYTDILNDSNPEMLTQFKNKIVMIGVEDRDDLHGRRWGFELHADAINTLLNRVLIAPVGNCGQFAVMMIMSIMGGLFRIRMRHLSRRRAMLLLITILLLYFAGTIYLYAVHHLMLNTVYHIVALFLTYWIVGKLERRYFQ